MPIWTWFQAQAAELGVPVGDAERDRFKQFHEILVEANKITNLTRIVDDRDAVIKHYLDSLLFLKLVPEDWHPKPLRLIDVGAGAGLPGIPLLIMRPHWQAVLVDSVGKKVSFMQSALEALSLDGSRAMHGRAEDLAVDPAYRDSFDLGVARAVAGMPELLELCLPFVKTGGKLLLSKGSKGPEELEAATAALRRLNGVFVKHEQVQLPEEAGERNLYVINKRDRTPDGYPRKAGIPHKKPIC